MSEFGDAYAATCRSAATDQGLDPIMSRLADEGIDCVLEQTGGFCMTVGVYREDGAAWNSEMAPYLWIVNAANFYDAPEGQWTVAWYDGSEEDEQGRELGADGCWYRYGEFPEDFRYPTADEALPAIRAWLLGVVA